MHRSSFTSSAIRMLACAALMACATFSPAIAMTYLDYSLAPTTTDRHAFVHGHGLQGQYRLCLTQASAETLRATTHYIDVPRLTALSPI